MIMKLILHNHNKILNIGLNEKTQIINNYKYFE